MDKKKSSTKRKINNSTPQKIVKGTLDITRSGVGFVIISKENTDIMVKQPHFNTALHGDTVMVKIMANHGKRIMGEIVQIVERKRTQFIGKIEVNKDFAFFVPDSERPMPHFYIPYTSINGATHGDKVMARLLKWEVGKNKKPVGEILAVLAAENKNDSSMKEIMLDAGFLLDFSPEVLEAALALPQTITQAEIDTRRDLRDITTITIDPDDAKDFDDAISIKKLNKTTYEIGVHIADVSHYIQPGDVIDKYAYQKATSVYLPDRVNPMLPEGISNVLCSLRPHEDKLTFSAIFEISSLAVVKKVWFGKTIIHSKHRFTYEDAQQIIETQQGDLQEEVNILHNLAQKLRKNRFQKGAINFSSQEVKFKLNEQGDPIGVVIKESKESHQLVEEFMLLANQAVADYVSKQTIKNKPIPFPYRVHDTPDEEKLLPFIAFANKFGHIFQVGSPEEITHSFNAMLSLAKGKPEQHVLEQLGIRTMAKAKYTEDNIGHYGLGFSTYCHFTSPIRRYPDVLVHRILQSLLTKQVHADKQMEEKCTHCSERERAAMECERKATKYKQVQYLSAFLGEHFAGVVSGVSAFGFWVETVEHKCEGLVSLQSLAQIDEFVLVETEYCLVGKRSGRKIRIGDKLIIQVAAANLDKRQLDYEWIIPAEEEAITKPTPKAKAKKA